MVDIGGGRVCKYGQNTWYKTWKNKETKKISTTLVVHEISHVLDFRF